MNIEFESMYGIVATIPADIVVLDLLYLCSLNSTEFNLHLLTTPGQMLTFGF